MKILIVRFSAIGDIVLTSPVIRCIKKQLPNAEVHYITKKIFKEIVENNPYIDKLHCFDGNLRKILSDLKKENFDYIIDLHHNLRSFILKGKLGIKSFSINKLNLEKWLMVNLKVNKLPHVHIVDRFFQTVKDLNVTNDGEGLDYFIPDHDIVELSTLPESHQKGYIALVIGAKHATKKLPLHKIIALCKQINKPVLMLGGKEDKATGDKVFYGVGSKVYNTCGIYNLNQSASLVQQADKVITHDTGMMHIAAAFKKDIISIWGNTIPAFGMYPYYPSNEKKDKSRIIEVRDLPCRPCSKLGFKECPEQHFKCMEEIDEKKITELLM